MVSIRKKYSVVGVICCVCIGVTATSAQVAPPSCEGCGNMPFVPLYAPRPIALVAKVRNDPGLEAQLWYITNSANDGLGVLSWNSHAQIVGTRFRYSDGVSPSTPRAFVWLPQAQYNLPAQEPHDLYALAHPANLSTPSFAWDISDEGLVVGGAREDAEADGESAHAWNLPLLPSSPTPPPFGFEIDFGTGGGDWTMALALTPSSPPPLIPRIVGTGFGACDEWREPFEFFFNPVPHAALISHSEPPPSELGVNENISRRAWACDIASRWSAPVGSHDQPDFVALENPCTSLCGDVVPCWHLCNGPMTVGVHFPDAFYRVSPPHFSAIPQADQRTAVRSSSGSAYGGSDLTPILAGYHQTDFSSSVSCPQLGVLWTYDTTVAVRNELPSIFARPNTGAHWAPIAQRWRGLVCPCPTEVVVGWSGEEASERLTGALWTTSLDPQHVGEFQAHQVSELLVDFAPPLSPSVWVEQVYDILPTGEILAMVRRRESRSGSDLFACILGLRGDITGDHAVNAADLSWFLANWGGIAEFEGDAPQVVADLNWDKKVDAADLGLLLGWWTGAPLRLLLPADGDELNGRSICMLQPGESCAAVGAELTLDTARAEECLRCAIGAFGFEQPDAFAAWLSTTSAESRETVCTCVSAFMRALMEDDNHD